MKAGNCHQEGGTVPFSEVLKKTCVGMRFLSVGEIMKTSSKAPAPRNTYVLAMTLRGSVTPMKDRRTKRTNRKSWKKDEWLL